MSTQNAQAAALSSNLLHEFYRPEQEICAGRLCFDIDLTLWSRHISSCPLRIPTPDEQKSCNITVELNPIDKRWDPTHTRYDHDDKAWGPTVFYEKKRICKLILKAHRLGVPVFFVTQGVISRKEVLERLEDPALEELHRKLLNKENERNFIVINRQNEEFRRRLLREEKYAACFLDEFFSIHPELQALEERAKMLLAETKDNKVDGKIEAERQIFTQRLLNETKLGTVTTNNKKPIICDYLTVVQGIPIDSSNTGKIGLIDDKWEQLDSFNCNYYKYIRTIHADMVTYDREAKTTTYHPNHTYIDEADKFLQYLFLSENNSELDRDFYNAIETLSKMCDELLATIPNEYINTRFHVHYIIYTKLTAKMAEIKERYYAAKAHGDNRLSSGPSLAVSSTSSQSDFIARPISSGSANLIMTELKAVAPQAENFCAECEILRTECQTQINDLVAREQYARGLVDSAEVKLVNTNLTRKFIQPINISLHNLFCRMRGEVLSSIPHSFVDATKAAALATQENFYKLYHHFFNDELCTCICDITKQIYSLKARYFGRDENAARTLQDCLKEIIDEMTTFAVSFLRDAENASAADLLTIIKESSRDSTLKKRRHSVSLSGLMQSCFGCLYDFPPLSVKLLRQLYTICDTNIKALRRAPAQNIEALYQVVAIPKPSVSVSASASASSDKKITPNSSVRPEMKECGPRGYVRREKPLECEHSIMRNSVTVADLADDEHVPQANYSW
ncbi:MAG: hypothetical protein M1561_05695 [Gammaproteobacteria bacterium]|nr:hypothetical protein [Gammaproteobacteria bacterium]